jgi:hypothetical protein
MPRANPPKISSFKKKRKEKGGGKKEKEKCRIFFFKNDLPCFASMKMKFELRPAPSALQLCPLHLLTPSSPSERAEREGAGRGGRDEGLPTISAQSGCFQVFPAPLVPKVSAENAWVPWISAAGGSVSERDERAGERGREGDSAAHAEWGREERGEEAAAEGGEGARSLVRSLLRSQAPVARSAQSAPGRRPARR